MLRPALVLLKSASIFTTDAACFLRFWPVTCNAGSRPQRPSRTQTRHKKQWKSCEPPNSGHRPPTESDARQCLCSHLRAMQALNAQTGRFLPVVYRAMRAQHSGAGACCRSPCLSHRSFRLHAAQHVCSCMLRPVGHVEISSQSAQAALGRPLWRCQQQM